MIFVEFFNKDKEYPVFSSDHNSFINGLCVEQFPDRL